MLVKNIFFFLSIICNAAVLFLGYYWHSWIYWFFLILIPYAVIGLFDLCSKQNVRRNYPVIGHLRYMFEFIRPEIQQYFVATNLSGRPYSREIRSLVYARAKGDDDNHPFGTEHDITDPGYFFAKQSLINPEVDPAHLRHMIGNHQCKHPYHASIMNISAMSYGALGPHAVRALNLGAKLGGFAQNTGEGGLSPYHLQHGGDICLQLGTGYFGMRDRSGHFDPKAFKELAKQKSVKMIEIKISQGAKPGHGGVLPKEKISEEIARIRKVSRDEDCLSPPAHTAFNSPVGLMHFIEQLRTLSAGKPVGFKLSIGKESEFFGMCKAMIKTKIYPDFITVDGAEGGTGAAPVEFTNRLGLPGDEALAFVHNTLIGFGVRKHITVIASGKIATAFDMIRKVALGADCCNVARAMMFTVGCIQSLKCHTNECPTGVATSDPSRNKALVVAHKAKHTARYHKATLKSMSELMGAMGVAHLGDLTPEMIFYRVDKGKSITYAELFHGGVKPGDFLKRKLPAHYQAFHEESSAESF